MSLEDFDYSAKCSHIWHYSLFLIIWVLRITVIAKYQREDSSKI